MDDSKKNKFDVISLVLKQSDAYDTIERIENLMESTNDLKALPVQPVYMAIKNLDADAVAKVLPKLSQRQRQIFLDIDLWNKDDVDGESFPFWLEAYSQCEDDQVKLSFVKSEQFLVYLKSHFNIWTFDVEDPEYPDHDYYFLTEDQQLLFEYHESYEQHDEIKYLIRLLYGDLGVEQAYSFLFKLTTDSFLQLQENEYRNKISRLNEYGLIDYYDALELCQSLPSLEHIDHFLRRKRESFTPEIDALSKNETLHHSALVAYREKLDRLTTDLDLVKNQKRLDFLHFNFLRMVNASISAQNALKDGRMALTRIGQKSRTAILLGHDYVTRFLALPENSELLVVGGSLFDRYDFVDLYKVGQTLTRLKLKELKKNLESYQFESENENFLGKYWVDFIDESFAETPQITLLDSDKNPKTQGIDRLDLYHVWCDRSAMLIELLPFMKTFSLTFQKLKIEGSLQDHFYLNYKVDTIDFEAILLSSFANHLLGSYDLEKNPKGSPKLGLTVTEFRKFVDMMLDSEGNLKSDTELFPLFDTFKKTFGLHEITGFNYYLSAVLAQQLEGYDYQNLDEKDFQHVGGPIILSLN